MSIIIPAKYGWQPELHDPRDKPYIPKLAAPKKLLNVDLRKSLKMPPITLQEISDCTGNGIASTVFFHLLNKKKPAIQPFQPSRLFIYFNERQMEGTVNYDNGAYIRDGIKSVAQFGVCPETEWIYDVSKFRQKPNDNCYTDALKVKALLYKYIDNTDKANIVEPLYNGLPVVFGFTVFPSFESNEVANTGVVPMPRSNERPIGGHCVYCIGYDVKTDRFICVNSWGIDWGNKGHFTIPADYLTNLADDFWVIEKLQTV